MGERDTRSEWDANAPAWIEMSRAGADRYRDLVNTPAFFDALPSVDGLRCLDIGCGEGHNTRLLRSRGAILTAVDVSDRFIRAARDADPAIDHVHGDGGRLPFADGTFDAATAFMSIMDTPDPFQVLHEAARVLRRGGWLQFSITHPMTTTRRRKWVDDEFGVRTWLAIGDYFHEGPLTDTWTFSSAPAEMRERLPPFTVTAVRRTVSSWLNMVTDAGFTIERVVEPTAGVDVADRNPDVADTRIVPFFLIVRASRAAR